MISLGHFWVISLGHFWVLFSRLFLNILTAAGGENAVVVQLTEEQLQLLISAEHLTHEVIKTHQQSSLNEIAPEMRSSAVISGMKAAYYVNLGTCVHLCAYFKLNFSYISDGSLTGSDCCNPHTVLKRDFSPPSLRNSHAAAAVSAAIVSGPATATPAPDCGDIEAAPRERSGERPQGSPVHLRRLRGFFPKIGKI